MPERLELRPVVLGVPKECGGKRGDRCRRGRGPEQAGTLYPGNQGGA